ncbi:glycoside hydrolase family 78 protein, partial [Thermaurantiacus sp.]
MPGTPDGPLTPVDLRVEHRVDPVAIDESQPQLSWRLQGEGHNRRQTGWRIIAASTRAAAEALEADLWDSGRRPGSDTLGIAWGGRPLRSLETVWWRVEASDEAGRSAWSAAASFGV